jgi:cell division septum initiation protein DivIVA
MIDLEYMLNQALDEIEELKQENRQLQHEINCLERELQYAEGRRDE